MKNLTVHLVTLEYEIRKLKNAMRHAETTCDMEQTVIDIEVAIAHLIRCIEEKKDEKNRS